jgi:RimJ/RimL family protein N-acetyltransferase
MATSDRQSRSRRPADPGALLATTHSVGEGLRVRLRLARPSDAPRVRAFLERLSPETRQRRFLVAMPGVGEVLVRHFTFYDPRERLVVVAAAPIGPGEELVGLADVALLSTGLAEIGIVVDDSRQGHGIGSLMSDALASLALRRGATHLKAELLADNAPMLKLMQRLGPTVRTVEDGHSVVYTRLATGRLRAA